MLTFRAAVFLLELSFVLLFVAYFVAHSLLFLFMYAYAYVIKNNNAVDVRTANTQMQAHAHTHGGTY